jgi:hypothetical protein
MLTVTIGASAHLARLSRLLGQEKEEHDMTYPNTTYPNTPLHIDIPVKLDDVKAVFSVAALSFEGNLPAPFFHLGLITNDIGDWGAASEVVVVFHTNAGHVTLDDAAYNADRNIETGTVQGPSHEPHEPRRARRAVRRDR